MRYINKHHSLKKKSGHELALTVDSGSLDLF